jgi:hypothetical protein
MPSRRDPPSGPRTVSFIRSRIRRPPGVAPEAVFLVFGSRSRVLARPFGRTHPGAASRGERCVRSGSPPPRSGSVLEGFSPSRRRCRRPSWRADQYDFVREVQSCFSSSVSEVFARHTNAIQSIRHRDASSIWPSTGLLPRGMKVQLLRVPRRLLSRVCHPPGRAASPRVRCGSVA